ncbi:aldehyde dehydrogenase family protein, partial [Mycolicibacterium vanbaalenii PYR-1]|nr:aldehyde dehydrogenase family protein [Mycolicibacterium vanbaalenii PYR-1]
AYPDWAAAAPHQRATLRDAAADELACGADELAVAHARESGKILPQARHEVTGAIACCAATRRTGPHAGGHTRPDRRAARRRTGPDLRRAGPAGRGGGCHPVQLPRRADDGEGRRRIGRGQRRDRQTAAAEPAGDPGGARRAVPPPAARGAAVRGRRHADLRGAVLGHRRRRGVADRVGRRGGVGGPRDRPPAAATAP